MSDYNALKTLTGLPLSEMRTKLDEELPLDAYKAVPGAVDLTDIDPNHMTRVLNDIFGLCGIGWGYTLNLDPRWDSYTNDKGRTVYSAHVPSLTFWYKMIDGDELTFSIPSTGGSENGSLAYALKGAITSAIGQAASKIGFQESVYLGKRDHRTVKGSGAAAVRKPAAAKHALRSPRPEGAGSTAEGAAAANPATVAKPGAQDGKADKGQANGTALDEAMAAVMPFATKQDPSVKGKTLGYLEEHKPNLVDWLAKNKAGDPLGQAATVIIAHRDGQPKPVAA
ncbi:MAG TPA: hypothetical protein VJ793_23480 [Anaerolineae bacterium]|nr:hypothetical protein [Anaerolineae bacterium]